MNKSSLDSILSQYEKNTDNNSSKPKISNEERLKKYFTEKFEKNKLTQFFQKKQWILPGRERRELNGLWFLYFRFSSNSRK